MNVEQEHCVVLFLETVQAKMQQEIDMMQKHGFVFDNLDDRWQKLAFTLYTDIAQLSSGAKQLLEYLKEENEICEM